MGSIQQQQRMFGRERMGDKFTNGSAVVPKIVSSLPVYGLKNHEYEKNRAQNGEPVF
jgi:hypothetical protein